MHSKSSGEAVSTLFKPRQVVLNSISNMKDTIQNGSETKTPISLTSQQRVVLHQSICQFLELNGFPKTLKKFRKELDFEKGSWKSCSLNLEEMCYQHLKMRNDTKVSDSAIEAQAGETVNRTKKNEGDEEKKIESKAENHSVDVKEKKRKSKKASELPEEITEGKPEDVPVSVPSEPEKKSKGKKKKHKKESQGEKEDDIQETAEKLDAISQEEKKVKSKSQEKKDDIIVTKEVDKEKKSSKKRKKSSSEEIDNGGVENATFDDSKRRKTDNLDQSNGTFLPKTPNGSANGVLEKDEKQASKKGKKLQHDGSAEPRNSANAFRRVKEEEVEFVDEKLQDNSYWAKEGADSGYGAKAQEVLGQVRGRDFRHEKTKKKRGSYRGGPIDLNSHSFKFNYDDDDE